MSEVLQQEEICVVRAIEATLRSKKSFDKLMTTAFEELPRVKLVLNIKKKEFTVVYQGIELKIYDQSVTYLKSHTPVWISSLEMCRKQRAVSNEVNMIMTLGATLLATNGRKQDTFGYEALDVVSSRFCTPFEKAKVDFSAVQVEWGDIVTYGNKFLNLVQDDYKVNKWKLLNSVDAHKGANVLKVIELLFCFPVSNGKLERIFSKVKLIKDDR